MIIDRRKDRRKKPEGIFNRSSRVITGSIVSSTIPHSDLGLQAVNRLGISEGQFLVSVVLEHHVLQQAS